MRCESRAAFCVGGVGPSAVVGPTTMHALVGRVCPQPSWLPGPGFCGGCWPADGLGCAGFQYSWLYDLLGASRADASSSQD